MNPERERNLDRRMDSAERDAFELVLSDAADAEERRQRSSCEDAGFDSFLERFPASALERKRPG